MSQGQSSAHWRTSSYSGNADGNCVEVGECGTGTAVRDTKDRHGGTHSYDRAAWAALRDTLRA